MQEATELCHRNDPDTSFEAAERLIRSGELTRQETSVCEAIVDYTVKCPGVDFTAKELAVQSGLDYYMISRRLSGLECKFYNPRGIIERTIYRRNGSAVWRLKPEESEVFDAD